MRSAVAVLDATGSIGRAVVHAAVQTGRPVVAVSSDYPALRRLKATHAGADLTMVYGAIADEGSADALAANLRGLERPLAGIVVATCSEPPRGRVLEQGTDALREIIDRELIPQLSAARVLVPLLAESGRSGSYVVIGGPGSEQPWSGYGLRSVSAAATRMLLRVLHDEARTLSVRVQLLAVEMPARTEDNHERACAQWPTAVAIGERALSLIDGHGTSREPAEAVVRYAWNAAPPLPAARTAPTPQRPGPGESYSRSGPERALDDTWALLKPYLTANPDKASTS